MAEQMVNAEAYIPQRPRLGPRLLRRKVGEALRAFHFKLWLANLLLGPLPILVGKRLRAQLYRFAGFRIGPDSRFLDRATFDALGNPYRNLRIGRRSQVGIGCHFSLNAPVSIGDDVIFGHYVRVLTDTHALGPSIRRCGERIARPVVIEDGVWLASNVVLLPGVTVGRGSVVASGAVVSRDVPPNCAVGGVPARVLRTLPEGVPQDSDFARELAAEMRSGGQPGLAEEPDGRTADADVRY